MWWAGRCWCRGRRSWRWRWGPGRWRGAGGGGADLTLGAPLAVPGRGGVQVQVSVAAPDQGGGREIQVHSRPEDSAGPWTRHASGLVTPAGEDHPDTGVVRARAPEI